MSKMWIKMNIFRNRRILRRFGRFLGLGGSDFNLVFFVDLVSSLVKFWIPTWNIFEKLFFQPYKGIFRSLRSNCERKKMRENSVLLGISFLNLYKWDPWVAKIFDNFCAKWDTLCPCLYLGLGSVPCPCLCTGLCLSHYSDLYHGLDHVLDPG